MSYEMVRCPTHEVDIPQVSRAEAEAAGIPFGCQACREDIASRPDASTMTPEERVAELRTLLGPPDFAGIDVVHVRVDALVGRPTLTHELAYPEYLELEIVTGSVPTEAGIIAKLPHDMPVTVVRASGEHKSPSPEGVQE